MQHVFEACYSYDLEALKKQNIGKAAKELASIRGVTRFGVAYVTQHGLEGHAIPVAEGIVGVLKVIGIVSDAEAKKQRVPGLERAIPKAKGIEFASLLHQLGAEFYSSPYGANIRLIVLEIAPDAKDRLPKKATKAEKAKQALEQEQAAKARASRKAAGQKPAGAPKKRAKKAAAADAPAKKKDDGEKKTTKAGSSGKRSPTKQLTRKKPR